MLLVCQPLLSSELKASRGAALQRPRGLDQQHSILFFRQRQLQGRHMHERMGLGVRLGAPAAGAVMAGRPPPAAAAAAAPSPTGALGAAGTTAAPATSSRGAPCANLTATAFVPAPAIIQQRTLRMLQRAHPAGCASPMMPSCACVTCRRDACRLPNVCTVHIGLQPMCG